MTSVAISTYLERWPEADGHSKRTINAFSKYRYGDKSTITQQYIAGDCEKRERLYNAYTKFYELFELRQAQAERDHEKKSVAPYKRGGTTKLDLITLSWCDAWSEGQFSIMRHKAIIIMVTGNISQIQQQEEEGCFHTLKVHEN